MVTVVFGPAESSPPRLISPQVAVMPALKRLAVVHFISAPLQLSPLQLCGVQTLRPTNNRHNLQWIESEKVASVLFVPACRC
jgi:hypothetical protein